jgi:DNA adenine methylase
VTEPADIRPFLRWAGSKRRLIKYLAPYIPTCWNRYYEPFLGGGALFFYLAPARAEISDASPELIRTYRAVRRYPDRILKFLRPLRPRRKTFERVKTRSARTSAEAAGSFIFLNKACWNGLYRVNSDGIFNVPFGWPRTDSIIDEENFRKASRQLRRREVRIRCQDFEEISDRVERGDFVFLDPPYVTLHNVNGFADWNESLFSWADQERLARMACRLVRRGANILITNANHPDVCALYRNFGYTTFNRSSTLAGDTTKRRSTSEAIFYAGPAYTDIKGRRFSGLHDGSDSRTH